MITLEVFLGIRIIVPDDKFLGLSDAMLNISKTQHFTRTFSEIVSHILDYATFELCFVNSYVGLNRYP